MAEQIPQSINANAPPHQETSCFGFLKKKEGKAEDDIVLTDKSDSNEGKYQEKRTLVDELQRKDSHSSSSSDEEVEEGGERKKKKGLKEGGENGGGPMEECSDDETKEKKGFVEKIKEKLPGHHEKEEIIQTHPPAAEVSPDKEKKGIIEKIKEKLPGHHKDE